MYVDYLLFITNNVILGLGVVCVSNYLLMVFAYVMFAYLFITDHAD